mgnify:CR=1 FL=1
MLDMSLIKILKSSVDSLYVRVFQAFAEILGSAFRARKFHLSYRLNEESFTCPIISMKKVSLVLSSQ